MNFDPIIYWLGWAVAAVGWFFFWLETQAHAENLKYHAHRYSKLKQMFADYRHREAT